MTTGSKNIYSILIFTYVCMLSQVVFAQKHKASANPYYEDLSLVRPTFQNPDSVTSASSTTGKTPANTLYQHDVTDKLNSRLDTLAKINQKHSTVQGFRILIYTGSSSDESQKMKQQVYAYNSDLNVYTQYKQPSFRVKVGDFIDRVEASYILNDLKKNFPNAMIVPDQINLVR
jgi:hypothetical protein